MTPKLIIGLMAKRLVEDRPETQYRKGEPKPLTPEASAIHIEAGTVLKPMAEQLAKLGVEQVRLMAEFQLLKVTFDKLNAEHWEAMHKAMPELRDIEFQITSDNLSYRQLIPEDGSPKPRQPDWAKEIIEADRDEQD